MSMSPADDSESSTRPWVRSWRRSSDVYRARRHPDNSGLERRYVFPVVLAWFPRGEISVALLTEPYRARALKFRNVVILLGFTAAAPRGRASAV
jgi:hypothetical protein